MTRRLFLPIKLPGPTASKTVTSKLQPSSCMISYVTRFKNQCSRLRRKRYIQSQEKVLLSHVNGRETINELNNVCICLRINCGLLNKMLLA